MSKAFNNVDLLNDLDIAFRSQFINAKNYGAKGDGVTDDTAALQAAIDAAVYTEKKALYIPSGKYIISDTLQAGYGTDFRAAHIFGDGQAYYAESQFAGTAIIITKSDRPAINFQGQRSGGLHDLTIRGQNFDWVRDNALGTDTPLVDDLNSANWVDPELLAVSPNMDSRYAPYAGITIDAYSGTQPSPSYPNVTYPAFLGTGIAQYNKALSSNILIRNVSIFGFVAGVVLAPSGSDGNGDFIKLQNVFVAFSKYGVSVGHTQSRNLEFTSTNIDNTYLCLTNFTHGKKEGSFGGTISNCHFAYSINMLLFSVYTKPIEFINCYSEGLWKLGEVVSGSSNEPPLLFKACQFAFQTQTNAKGVPPYILGYYLPNAVSSGQSKAIIFEGCEFASYPSVLVFGGAGPVVLRYCRLRSENRISGPKDSNGTDRQYVAYASNGTCDGLILMNGAVNQIQQSVTHYNIFDVDTLAIGTNTYAEAPYSASRSALLPYTVKQAVWAQSTSDEFGVPIWVPRRGSLIDKGGLASCTLSDKTLTFVFSARTDADFAYAGPDIGDVVVDMNTGSTFFVRNRSSLTVTAELQNNYKASGGGFVTLEPFSTTLGNFLVINSRFYIVPRYLRGTSTAGSAVLANCARDDGFAAWYDAQIAVNDWLFVNVYANNWIAAADTKVTARNQGAGTITLSGNAARSLTREPLLLFIRQAATAVP